MHSRDFDDLARHAAAGLPRRRVLGALAGVAAALLGRRVEAAPGDKKKCRNGGALCAADGECCAGRCEEPGICPCEAGLELCRREGNDRFHCFAPCPGGQVFNGSCRCVCEETGERPDTLGGCPCDAGREVCRRAGDDRSRCFASCPAGQVFDGDCRCVCADSGKRPKDGVCPCPSGQVQCAGVCVDLLSNPDRCGDCLTQCSLNEICAGGVCSCPTSYCGDLCLEAGAVCCDDTGGSRFCPAPFACCDGGCVDLPTSREHCGACGIACGGGQSCVAGVCTCDTPGETVCGTLCCPAAAPYCYACSFGSACSSYPSGGVCCGTGVCAPGSTCCEGGTTCCSPPFECCGGDCISCGAGLTLDPATCACV